MIHAVLYKLYNTGIYTHPLKIKFILILLTTIYWSPYRRCIRHSLPNTDLLSFAVCHPGEDCVWNKDTDYPDNPPLILDVYLKLVLPVKKDTTREVR